MSILIRGMEMPTDRSRWVVIYPDGKVDYSDKTDEWETLKDKAVPVPPHGRLIDADALIAKLNMMIAMAFGEGNTAFHFAYRSLGKVVENAPTIIEAEEGE